MLRDFVTPEDGLPREMTPEIRGNLWTVYEKRGPLNSGQVHLPKQKKLPGALDEKLSPSKTFAHVLHHLPERVQIFA